MQHLEVSGAVRLIYRLLGVKGLSTWTLPPIRACFGKSVLGRGIRRDWLDDLQRTPQRRNFVEIRHVVRERQGG